MQKRTKKKASSTQLPIVRRKRKHATLPKTVKITYSDYALVPMTAKQAAKEAIQ